MYKYFKDIFESIFTVLVGMRITLIHLFARNVTIQYPNVHPLEKAGTDIMPDNARNRLKLIPNRCNGCNSCARECPVNCITISTIKVTPDDPDQPTLIGLDKDGNDIEQKRNLWVSQYDIDFAKCCFCGICTEVCPTEAIITTTEFEYSTDNVKDLYYRFSEMSSEQAEEKTKLFAIFDAEKKKKAAAAKKAKEAAEKKEEEKS